MTLIIKDDKSIFEISNNLVSLYFYKNGKNRGTYKIKYNGKGNNTYYLKKIYCSINLLSENYDLIREVSSKDFEFNFKIEEIRDFIRMGKRILLVPKKSKDSLICFSIQFTIYENQDYILIKIIDIEYTEKFQERIHSISPLTIKASKLWLTGNKKATELDKITWFKHGWQSWSPCKLIKGNEYDSEGSQNEIYKRAFDNQDYKIRGRFYSETCTVITDIESKGSLILGFVTLKDQFSRIILDYENYNEIKLLTAFGCMDGIILSESTINSSEELYIVFKSNNQGYTGLLDYSKILSNKIDNNRIKAIPIGWCSWYYYFTEVKENDIFQNLEFFKSNRKKFPIDFIQLDDGYFTNIGDYRNINSKFPNGLKELFQKITQSGFKGGIWTAPFFAVRKSKLFKNHKEWFLRDKNTKKLIKAYFNWNTFEYPLDLSKNEVLSYLNRLYSDLIYAFKKNIKSSDDTVIKFFKIDFLHAAVPFEGDYANKTLTRAQILYNGVKTIREAIKSKSYLLGCGAPLSPCIGLVDGMRIGEDTAPYWEDRDEERTNQGIIIPSLKISLLNILYRSFMHKHFWINDPDCLMIRRNNTDLNLNEIRLQITIFGLSGGQLLISEDMNQLTEEEINDAKILIPPYNPKEYNPILVNAFTSELPTIYTLETNEIIGKRFLAVIINWEDKFLNKKLELNQVILNNYDTKKDYYVFDFWNKTFLGRFNGDHKIQFKRINPHSCVFISIIPIDEKILSKPILLSTSLHISQGCHEIKNYEFDPRKSRLLIEIELIGRRKGSLYLKLPPKKQISNYRSKFHIIDETNNVWEIFIEFEDKAILELQLS